MISSNCCSKTRRQIGTRRRHRQQPCCCPPALGPFKTFLFLAIILLGAITTTLIRLREYPRDLRPYLLLQQAVVELEKDASALSQENNTFHGMQKERYVHHHNNQSFWGKTSIVPMTRSRSTPHDSSVSEGITHLNHQQLLQNKTNGKKRRRKRQHRIGTNGTTTLRAVQQQQPPQKLQQLLTPKRVTRRSSSGLLLGAATRNLSGNVFIFKKEIQCWSFEQRCAILLNQTASFQNQVNHSSIRNHTTYYDVGPGTTLALNDPLLRDGYRNQFMRFVMFTIYALQHGFEKILLPSIRWNCDHRKNRYDSVPFEQLFDVDYWNHHHIDLPRLVTYNESEHYDWDPFTGLFRGACDVLDVYLKDPGDGKDIIFNRTWYYQHPVPYGGGIGLGMLFKNYKDQDCFRETIPVKKWNVNVSFLEIEAKIIRAMRPTATMERLLQQTMGADGGNDKVEPPYMALHARIEPEMLAHPKCREQKVSNLTTILDMIRGMDHDAKVVAANPSLYIAIGVPEMEEGNKYKIFQLEHQLNMAALQHTMLYGLDLPTTGQNLTVSVGAHVATIDNDDVIDSCASEIVSSVISFEVAVRANIFIGTFISTWSATVWKARHALGRGKNFAYTPDGLVEITGAPPPFEC